MGCSATNSLASKNLMLHVDQDSAGKSIRQAPRKRHAVQNRTDEEFESFVVKTVRGLPKLRDLFFPSLSDGRKLVPPEAAAKRITEFGEVLSKGRVVVSRPFLELSQRRRRRRLVECLNQLLLGLACLELLRLADSPDIVQSRQSKLMQRMNRLRLDGAREEVCQSSVDGPCDPQIARQCWLRPAQSPVTDGSSAHARHSSEVAQTLNFGHTPKQTRQLLASQQGRFFESRSDHVLDLIGGPNLPLRSLNRKKKVFAAVLHHPIGAKPLFASMAVCHGAALSQKRLRPFAIGAHRLKKALMFRAVFHSRQCPKQGYVNRSSAVAPTVQAPRTPAGNSSGYQLCGKEQSPRKHREVIKISSPSELPDHVGKSSRSASQIVEGRGLAPSSGSDRAGKHVAAPRMQRQDFAVGQCACGHEVCFSEAGKIACQTFDHACTESDRSEVVKTTARWKVDFTQIQRFVSDHIIGRHARRHDWLQ